MSHPLVSSVGLCDPSASTLKTMATQFGVPDERCHGSIEEVIDSGRYDAVMLLSPIPFHAAQSVAVLEAGLHCACTVPMATSEEDCQRITQARRKSGKTYCLLETSLTTNEFLLVQNLVRQGEFGDLQFLRGVWHNHLDQHAKWWHGLPPMHYITHPLAPMLALTGRKVRNVSCFGSGTMPAGFAQGYGNPFPIETAIFALGTEPLSEAFPVHGDPQRPLAIEITCITSDTALVNKETFDVFGSKQSFFWAAQRGEDHVLVRRTTLEPTFADKSNPTVTMNIKALNLHRGLPDSLKPVWGSLSIPALIHEFVSASVAQRPSLYDVELAEAVSLPGIWAHQAALQHRQA
jgi:predicted dehydrogenase